MANKDQHEDREDRFLDIDRMVNEGLGGGNVTLDNGLIEETTTDTMEYPESILDDKTNYNAEQE
ncbi:hypothetical protein DFP94_106187 [Fontibacillus phaseoli]|uniref:Uncharacterized protein n=1 Tax=Fontibacillus phaseoli TaxID=1416533 RepID=A0A369BAV3_9BACL|nr:hypothetical protein [Fontibacillus phaseoli]RCX18653.1 hypothetical protein DFP94_106187 [Fontibacillus phaseoli]